MCLSPPAYTRARAACQLHINTLSVSSDALGPSIAALEELGAELDAKVAEAGKLSLDMMYDSIVSEIAGAAAEALQAVRPLSRPRRAAPPHTPRARVLPMTAVALTFHAGGMGGGGGGGGLRAS